MIKRNRKIVLKVFRYSIHKHWLYTPREKLQDCTWDFTLGDADDHPSVPHAHAREYGYRLDAWTGNIYPAGNNRKNIIGHLNRKELQKLHSDKKFIVFASKQIDWYKKANPNIDFYIPEWFKKVSLQVHRRTYSRAFSHTTLTFIGKAVIEN